MSSSIPSFRLLTALVVAVVMLFLTAPTTVFAQEPPRVVIDLNLSDGTGSALDTSILLSRQTFQSAEEVIVATAVDGADALASGSLQSGVGGAAATTVDGEAVEGRPLFLVDPTEELPLSLLDEMARLGATSVIVLGGESAIPGDLADALGTGGADVMRMGGTTRLATAVEIANFVLANDADVSSVFLSRAFGTETNSDTAFADSSALGGWAAQTGQPVLLTATDELSLETSAFLLENSLIDRIAEVQIIGGPAAVGEAPEGEVQALDLTTSRFGGETREQTAVAIADGRGMAAPTEFVLTEGWAEDFFVSSFTAAAYSGLSHAPILLSNNDLIAPIITETIGMFDPSLADSGAIVNCTPAVQASVCAAVAQQLGAEVQVITPDDTVGEGGSEDLPGGGDLPLDPDLP